MKLFDLNLDPASLPGAAAGHQRGFFMGLHTDPLKPELLTQLAEALLGFPF